MAKFSLNAEKMARAAAEDALRTKPADLEARDEKLRADEEEIQGYRAAVEGAHCRTQRSAMRRTVNAGFHG
jgi:hypothetical protein